MVTLTHLLTVARFVSDSLVSCKKRCVSRSRPGR